LALSLGGQAFAAPEKGGKTALFVPQIKREGIPNKLYCAAGVSAAGASVVT